MDGAAGIGRHVTKAAGRGGGGVAPASRTRRAGAVAGGPASGLLQGRTGGTEFGEVLFPFGD